MLQTINLITQKRLKKLVETAGKKPGHAEHRLYAEIWDASEKKRLAWGWNSPDVSELSQAYAKHEEAIGTHAEVAAIVNALSRHVPVRGGHMFVARAKKIKRGGPFISGVACPCNGCFKLLADFGIASVTWTEEQMKDYIPYCSLLPSSTGTFIGDYGKS